MKGKKSGKTKPDIIGDYILYPIFDAVVFILAKANRMVNRVDSAAHLKDTIFEPDVDEQWFWLDKEGK